MEDQEGATKRITANLPGPLLSAAQAATGEGITETLVQGMELIFRLEAGRVLADLRGRKRESLLLFADSAALVGWLTGSERLPVLDYALLAGELRIPDMVAAEVAAHPDLSRHHRELHKIFLRVPKLPVDGERWARVASLKAHCEARGKKISTVEAELVQAAMDHGATVVVRNPLLKDLHKVCGVRLQM